MEMERVLCVATYFPIIYTFLDIFTAFRNLLLFAPLFLREPFSLEKIINMPKNFTC